MVASRLLQHALIPWLLIPLIAPGLALAATVTDLRCEYRTDPLGVDVTQPRLSWVVTSGIRGERQTAYQIQAASNPDLLTAGNADLWDSGKVVSDPSALVPYAGRTLATRQRVFWRIRMWDRTGAPSGWSPTAKWTMGLLHREDWLGTWITANPDPKAPLPLFRRVITAEKPVIHAELHICGLGQFVASIDSKPVSDAVLEPGWTNYRKTCLYRTYDVSGHFTTGGEHVLGVRLGNGMYNVVGGRYSKFRATFGPPKLIAQLHLDYADGTSAVVATDAEWRTAPGPITFSCIYGGEDYDARREPSGWDGPGFQAADWQAATVCSGPGGELVSVSASAPPIRRFELLQPKSSTVITPDTTVYDLGQNAALVPGVTVRGPAGSVVRITPSELLARNGTVDRGSCAHGGKPAYVQYTLRGDGRDETWNPSFYYHGCRYLQVECQPATGSTILPLVSAISGTVVHADSPTVGSFACSNELFNRIHTLVRWAQRSNMMSVMTDCPHREKLGWLEEDHLNGPALRYNFDLAQLSAKMMNDMQDAQETTGLIPDIAPEYTVFKGGFRDSPEWGSAFLLVPWQHYLFSSDTTLLRRHYDAMQRYVAYLGSKAKDHIVDYGLGDWYDIGPKGPGKSQLTPLSLTATAFYFADVEILAKTATILGKPEDAARYGTLAGDIRRAFIACHFDAKTGQFASGSQCANAIPLVMGLAEPEQRAGALAGIIDDVRKRGDGLTAGDVGYRYLLRALADGGRSDVIFAINNRSDKPGYGMQLVRGATALTEAWDAGRSSSQNHFMLGQITEWFYHDLAGIRPDPEHPGFARVLIRPALVGDLTWVEARYRSIRGEIVSRWEITDHRAQLTVTIPANATARIWIPTTGDLDSISESATPLRQADEVAVIGREDQSMVVETGSGTYRFTAPWQVPAR